MDSPTRKRLRSVLPTMPTKKKPKKGSSENSWEDVAREAKAHRDATIIEAVGDIEVPEAYGTNVVELPAAALDEASLRITALEVQELVDSAATGHYSAVEIVTAFMKRAAVAQKLVSDHTA